MLTKEAGYNHGLLLQLGVIVMEDYAVFRVVRE